MHMASTCRSSESWVKIKRDDLRNKYLLKPFDMRLNDLWDTTDTSCCLFCWTDHRSPHQPPPPGETSLLLAVTRVDDRTEPWGFVAPQCLGRTHCRRSYPWHSKVVGQDRPKQKTTATNSEGAIQSPSQLEEGSTVWSAMRWNSWHHRRATGATHVSHPRWPTTALPKATTGIFGRQERGECDANSEVRLNHPVLYIVIPKQVEHGRNAFPSHCWWRSILVMVHFYLLEGLF